MGFMLYVISAWNKNGDGIYPPCPFVLESINVNPSEENIFEKRKSISKVIREVKCEYQNAQIIQTEQVEFGYVSPSSFHNDKNDFSKNSTEQKYFKNPQIEIDKVIQSFTNNEFGYDSFGTIAHAYAEGMFKKQQPNIPSYLTQMLSEKQKAIIFEEAQNMAQRFYDSELGQLAQKSDWTKNEYDFKLLAKANSKIGNIEFDSQKIIRGQIDLVFRNPNKEEEYIIVDFKTDTEEIPEIHKNQLEIYRLAVSKFKTTNLSNVKCYLFYFRSGNYTEI
jgi:hypothetical protein